MKISGTDQDLTAAIATHDRAERWQDRSRRLLGFMVPSGGLAWVSMIWPRLLSPTWHFVVAAAWPRHLTVSRRSPRAAARALSDAAGLVPNPFRGPRPRATSARRRSRE